jgi:hypothetical protein
VTLSVTSVTATVLFQRSREGYPPSASCAVEAELRVPEPTEPIVTYDIQHILGAIVLVVIIGFLLSSGIQRLHLAFRYNVAPWNVVINRYPDDECSFWHVPRGHKDCYHEEIIRTFDWRGVQVEPDSGRVDSLTVSWGGKVSR